MIKYDNNSCNSITLSDVQQLHPLFLGSESWEALPPGSTVDVSDTDRPTSFVLDDELANGTLVAFSLTNLCKFGLLCYWMLHIVVFSVTHLLHTACICIHTCIDTCKHTYACTHAFTHKHIHMCTHIHTNLRIDENALTKCSPVLQLTSPPNSAPNTLANSSAESFLTVRLLARSSLLPSNSTGGTQSSPRLSVSVAIHCLTARKESSCVMSYMTTTT